MRSNHHYKDRQDHGSSRPHPAKAKGPREATVALDRFPTVIEAFHSNSNSLWQAFSDAHNIHMNDKDGDNLRITFEPGHSDIAVIVQHMGEIAELLKDGQPVTKKSLHEYARAARPANAFAENRGQITASRGPGARSTGSVANFKPMKRQAEYLAAIESHSVTFGVGPAGTGKTYAAVATAVQALESGKVKRIILVRPAQDAGEKLGYLPGDANEKVSPFMRPFFDALRDFGYVGDRLQRLAENETIEIAPVAFMRGRTLSDAYILVDEAQNLTIEQMRMLLTRPKNSRVIVTGDPSQTDLGDAPNGLQYALDVFKGSPKARVGIFEFNESDVVRDDLVADVLEAFKAHAEKRTTAPQPTVSQMPASQRRAANTP